MPHRYIPPNNSNLKRQDNSNIVDRAMFDRLLDKVYKIEGTLDELKSQSSWNHPMPIFPLPPLSLTPKVPYPPYPSYSPNDIGEQQYTDQTQSSVQKSVDVPTGAQEFYNSTVATQEPHINILQLISKYHKIDENLTLIVAWLQYFLTTLCKQKMHTNWLNKKDYTRAELLLVLTSNPSILGEDFEKVIVPIWIVHLRENINSYMMIFKILVYTLFTQQKISADVKYNVEVLVAYLNAPRNIIFTKKNPNKSTTISNPVDKDFKKESYRIKITLKAALEKTLIQFMATALSIQMLSNNGSALNNLQQDLTALFEKSNYTDKCSYLVNIAQTGLLARQKLADAKKAKKLTEASKEAIKNKDENLGS